MGRAASDGYYSTQRPSQNNNNINHINQQYQQHQQSQQSQQQQHHLVRVKPRNNSIASSGVRRK